MTKHEKKGIELSLSQVIYLWELMRLENGIKRFVLEEDIGVHTALKKKMKESFIKEEYDDNRILLQPATIDLGTEEKALILKYSKNEKGCYDDHIDARTEIIEMIK